MLPLFACEEGVGGRSNGEEQQVIFNDQAIVNRPQKGMRYMKAQTISTLILMTAGALAPALASAQAVPDAGTFIRELETAPVSERERADEAQIDLPEAAPITEATASEGVAVQVNGFTVTGNEAFDSATLERLVADFNGRQLTLGELQQAANRITRHYREHGYFLARAYLPQQDVSGGIVAIAVLEGRLGQIDLTNQSRTRDFVIERPLKSLQSGQMLRARDFETPLLRLSDLPGIEVSTTLAPGSETGTSDLNVQVTPGPLLQGTVELDNYGNPYIGEYRLGASLRVNSPFGLGDRFDLRALGSDEEQVFFRAQYALPVGPWATELGAAYSDMDYELGDEFAEIGATGNAQIVTAFARQSFIRTRGYNLEAQLQYDHKSLEDSIEQFASVSEKSSELYTLTVMGDWRDDLGGGAITRYALAYTRGDLTLDSYLDQVIDGVTAQTAGSFNRWMPSLMRLQNLGSNWSLYAQIHGQFANKNLDSSEKFSLGGAYGVRAYAQGEATGDEGWLANVELRYDINRQWQVYALLDHGEVERNKKPWDPAVDNDRSLSGAGIGARWGVGPFHLNATLATPIGSEDATVDDSDPRLFAKLVYSF